METKSKIITALFKLAIRSPKKQHFTITEIAKEANLTRQAIYRKHFSSADEIIEYIHDIIKSDVAFSINFHKENDKDQTLFSILSNALLPTLYEHRDWIKLLHKTSVDDSWTYFFEKTYQDFFIPYIGKDIKTLGISKEIAATLLIRYIIAIVSVWLSQEYPEPPQVFESTFKKLMSDASQSLVSN
ncbi:MAG TPA: TetR/AcrR family transcriptional regulator [Lactovum miscens]|uniref:TetR/AcrR family transcriptional regulator n=1 Tax=Lactovum miscens TaxID=190387 RepID=UPI002EDAE618